MFYIFFSGSKCSGLGLCLSVLSDLYLKRYKTAVLQVPKTRVHAFDFGCPALCGDGLFKFPLLCTSLQPINGSKLVQKAMKPCHVSSEPPFQALLHSMHAWFVYWIGRKINYMFSTYSFPSFQDMEALGTCLFGSRLHECWFIFSKYVLEFYMSLLLVPLFWVNG